MVHRDCAVIAKIKCFANDTDLNFMICQKVVTPWEKTELQQFRESLGLQQLRNQVFYNTSETRFLTMEEITGESIIFI